MNEADMIDCLCKLNFTKLEAQIYLTLLNQGDMSGYQLAKKIDISRPSIYNALNHMYEKGIVLLIADNSSVYKAENPSTLFERLNDEYAKNSQKASMELKKLFEEKHEEQFINMKGFDSILYKIKELLLSAKKEVYINTNFNLQTLKEEFKVLKTKGIRVIVFSFMSLDIDDLDIEFYTHNRSFKAEDSSYRMMVVVDQKITLVADAYKERSNWLGTITNNPLMVSIVTEHIHNDIYLLNLRKRHGKGLFDDEIRINTDFES